MKTKPVPNRYNISQFMQLVGIKTKATVRRLVERGQLPDRRSLNGKYKHRFFTEDDVQYARAKIMGIEN